jgi:hypothetical protein
MVVVVDYYRGRYPLPPVVVLAYQVVVYHYQVVVYHYQVVVVDYHP